MPPMSRFVNAALVTFLNGFVLLTVLGYFLGNPEEGSPEAPSLGEVRASWGPASAQDSVLLLEAPLTNTGQGALRATQAHYEVRGGGALLASGDVPLAAAVPPGISAPLRIPLHLGPDFPARFWDLYASGGERVQLRATGTVDVQGSGGNASLPFSWSESWRGGLASGLAAARPSCDKAQPVCVTEATLSWRDGGATVRLEMRNQGSVPITVDAVGARLALGGADVLAGRSGPGLSLAPHGSGTVQVRASVAAEALPEWWAGHVARCEVSPAVLSVDLALQDAEGTARSQPVVLHAPAFETHLVCGDR